MPDDPLAELGATLRVPTSELTMLARFSTAEVTALARAVEHALHTQHAEFDAAMESALGFIPRVLRGRARKLLFGAA